MSCYVIKLFGWFYNQTAHFEFTNSLLFNQIVPGGWLKTDFATKELITLGLLTSIEGPAFWRRLFQRFLPPAKDQIIIFLSRLDDKAAEGRGGSGGQRGNQDPTLHTASASKYWTLHWNVFGWKFKTHITFFSDCEVHGPLLRKADQERRISLQSRGRPTPEMQKAALKHLC